VDNCAKDQLQILKLDQYKVDLGYYYHSNIAIKSPWSQSDNIKRYPLNNNSQQFCFNLDLVCTQGDCVRILTYGRLRSFDF
jgi:hypothetical protein